MPLKNYVLKKNDGSEYVILEIIGIGASTVTYLTEYKNIHGIINQRIIKEYCPNYLNITRDDSYNILFNDEKKVGYNLISLSNNLDIAVKRVSPKNFFYLYL